MQAAENIIEFFPTWATTPKPISKIAAVDWVAVGAEADIKHICKLWQRVLMFRLADLPDDLDIFWQIANALSGSHWEAVRFEDGVVSIDRRHLAEFREQVEFLWDHLVDEHGDHRYRWCHDLGDYVRIESEEPPITHLEDARRAISIIDGIRDLVADTVVYLREGI